MKLLPIILRVGRIFLLLILVAIGTTLLMRFAPGYFTDPNETEAKYSEGARSKLDAIHTEQDSLRALASKSFAQWFRGDLGRSRQYDVPVSGLLRSRIHVTFLLVVRGLLCGWLLAFCTALSISALRRWAGFAAIPFTVALAVPAGALATLCLVTDIGGPTVVLTLLLAARDFKFLHRLLRDAWKLSHVLYARAQGQRTGQLIRNHILPNVFPQMIALAGLSLITALSAIVPLEVIFDVPGIGQLAWTAAMNRDLPVLLAVTIVMACAVAVVGMIPHPLRSMETS